jgi:hypothetical protein
MRDSPFNKVKSLENTSGKFTVQRIINIVFKDFSG